MLLALALHPSMIVGVYQLIAPLGSGGMGDVYRARDSRLGRQVAIKFVSSRLYGNAEPRPGSIARRGPPRPSIILASSRSTTSAAMTTGRTWSWS